MELLKAVLRLLLTVLYRVRVDGLEHYRAAGERVMIVANHTSFLDAMLLSAFLPDRLTYAINTRMAQRWWVRPFLTLVDFFPMDPTNPLAARALVKYLQEDRKAVIFPEGRITVTGALMKIYQGPGLIADKSGALVLPVRIDGAQYTPFSRLRGRVRLRWFPRITLTLLPPRRLRVPGGVSGQERREQAGRALSELMAGMMFATSNYRRTVFGALLDARRIHGGRHTIVEDSERRPLSYNQLIRRTWMLGRRLQQQTFPGERVGLLLPNMVDTLSAFLALQLHGRVPVLLDSGAGENVLSHAVVSAGMRTLCTSRVFVKSAKLGSAVERLSARVRVRYLEDMWSGVTWRDRLGGSLACAFARACYRRVNHGQTPDDAAVVLFASGPEALPKGVALSHANLLANCEQVAGQIDLSSQDVVLNPLPVSNAFGLSVGTLLPLISGVKLFLYPAPLHHRIIPELAYDLNATLLFGTDPLLAEYARHAHPYDFYSIRYVFAGTEKPAEETRRLWADKFSVRVLGAYGATETGPVLAMNTPMDYRAGTVGRLLPGIEFRLDPVPGNVEGMRLTVRGPNVMLGYLLPGQARALVPPETSAGKGWYDTGDLVQMDADGLLRILGRVGPDVASGRPGRPSRHRSDGEAGHSG